MNEPEGLSLLIAAMTKQTEAITRLAQSNEMLVQAMIDSEGMDSGDMSSSSAYLNGANKE